MRNVFSLCAGLAFAAAFGGQSCVASSADNSGLEIAQKRELNMVLAQRKSKQPVMIENTTGQPVSFLVTCCLHASEIKDDTQTSNIDANDCPFLINPSDPFGSINVNAFDETLFPIYPAQNKNVMTAAVKNPTESTALWLQREYTIKAGESLKLIPHEFSYLSRIKLNTPSTTVRLDTLKNGNFKLTVIGDFKPFYPVSPGATDFSDLASKRSLPLIDFFKSTVCPAEGFVPAAYIQKLQDLYDMHASLINTTSFSAATRISLIMHSVWPSDDAYSEQHIKWLLTSMQSCKPSNGWKHIMWVKGGAALSQLNDQLHELGLDPAASIEIKDIKEIVSPLQTNIAELIQSGDFVGASRLLRLVLLNQNGGVFRGADVEVLHDLAHYHRAFDLYTGLDHDTAFLPAMGILAAAPNHPTIAAALALIQRNLAPTQRPAYVSAAPQDADVATLTCGGAVLATAIMKSDSVLNDIVLPPRILCPMIAPGSTGYPDASVRLFPDVMAINHSKRYGGIN